MDKISKERRSWNMSRIRARNTKPEYAVRSIMHRLGLRFRLHRKDLPGKPDIVLPKHKTVVFVHGCYWHRHSGCRNATTPSTNREFWEKKFEENVKRDERNKKKLEELGWSVITLWECEIKEDPVSTILDRLARSGIIISDPEYDVDQKKTILKVAEERFEKSW